MQEIKGVGVALATPLDNNYAIDFVGLRQLVLQVSEKVDYLVVLGTTGESPVFTWKEKLQILEFVLEVNQGRKPVVFGHGGNNTYDLIEKSKDLKTYRLAAILSASPYYSKPSQEGIIRHYEMLGDTFPHPIVLYNVPARTASNMVAETTLKLAQHPNIIAMKEASQDLEQCKRIIENKADDFTFLSGKDSFTFELLQNGADGVISVIANAIPDTFSAMVHAGINGKIEEAKRLNESLQMGYKLASAEGNPSSIKAALEALKVCKRTVKPPLFDASEELVESWMKYDLIDK